MDTPVLKVQLLRDGALAPAKHHLGDAGMDLYAYEGIELKPGDRVKVSTGVALAIPEGFVGLIWDKSGLSNTHGLKSLGGVIDSGYRGEIMVGLINLSSEVYRIEKGHKVAQLLLQKIEHMEVRLVGELDATVRGDGAFGSTGK